MPAFPPKTNYASGDILTAAQMNDVGNALSAYQFTVGKNKIINGDFSVNQRNFSTTSTDGTYTFDRFTARLVDGTVSASASTFTLGTAPVAGYESRNFLTLTSSGQTASNAQLAIQQSIESVRTFANQTATVSFWAKAASGTPKIAVEIQQNFGTTNNPSAEVFTYAGQVTLSTSWARYSVSVAIPSIAGKILGTDNNDKLNIKLYCSAGSNFNARLNSLGIQSNTFDIWGVQVEAGSTATPFTTASGSIQGELALCQRYYFRFGGNAVYQRFGSGIFASATTAYADIYFPVPMRANPTTIDANLLGWYDGGATGTITAATLTNTGRNSTTLNCTTTGGTQYRPFQLSADNSTSAYLGLGAEL